MNKKLGDIKGAFTLVLIIIIITYMALFKYITPKFEIIIFESPLWKINIIVIILLTAISIIYGVKLFQKNKITPLNKIIRYSQILNYIFLWLIMMHLIIPIIQGRIIFDLFKTPIEYQGKCYITIETYSPGIINRRNRNSIYEYYTLILRKNKNYSDIIEYTKSENEQLIIHNGETSNEIFLPIHKKILSKISRVNTPLGYGKQLSATALCDKNIHIKYLPYSKKIIFFETSK